MYNKEKDPFVAISGKLYSTGRKSPAYEFSIQVGKFQWYCSVTKRKYRFSEYLSWYKSPEIQKYVAAGWVAYVEAKTQEPYQQPKYGDNIEMVFSFRLKKPFTPKAQGIDGFKKVQVPPVQPMPQAIQQSQVSVEIDKEMDDDLPPF